jgi:transposase-like protein
MTDGPEPLKTDAVGRVRTPAAKRAEILAAFERSGVSGVEFAALIGVKYPTFASWLQARRRPRGEAGTGPRPPVRFVEAAVPPPPAEAQAPVELELPGGVRLRLTEPAQVPLVVALLRGLRSC